MTSRPVVAMREVSLIKLKPAEAAEIAPRAKSFMPDRMKFFLRTISALVMLVVVAAIMPVRASTAEGWLEIEETVAKETTKSQITIVHFWAPWCLNSLAELKNNGWSTFIDSNFDVKFVFVTVRSAKDGFDVLRENSIGQQQNLTVLHHPNHVRSGEGMMDSFMDMPVSWLPATWIFRNGKLRYALNYGEVRFPLLQQLVRDTGEKWEH